MKMCYAENAVIVEDNGATVRFHPRCPKCGKVLQNVTATGHCSNGSSSVGYYSCYGGCPSFPVVLHR